MGFVWSEIKKWAKANGMEPTKSKDGLYHFDGQSHKDIEPIVKLIYNKITNNKWKEHQEKFNEKNS